MPNQADVQHPVDAIMPSDELISRKVSRAIGSLVRVPARTWFLRSSLAIVLLMTFRTFQGFPGMNYVQEFWFVLCGLSLVFIYLPWKISMGMRFSAFEGYVLGLMLAVVVLPTWEAWREFGQPISYGILAARGVTLYVVALFLVNALRARRLRLADVEASLLLAAWGTFILYSLMRLALNASAFASYEPAFVVTEAPGHHVIFKLPSWFILFGAIYYALQGIRTRHVKFYIAAAILFIFGALGLSERALTLSFVLTLMIFLFRWRRVGDFTIAAGKFLCLAAVGMGMAWIVSPSLVTSQLAKFSDAFTVVLSGSNVEDASANARLVESLQAAPYILKHPWLGSGVVSRQWQGGSQAAVGDNFYESDIGVIGVVFSYGVLGLLVFAWQYQFALRGSGKMRRDQHTPLFDAVRGYLVFTALISTTTGTFVWSAEITLFYIALLVGIVKRMELETGTHPNLDAAL